MPLAIGRRELIAALGSAVAWSLAGRAQQVGPILPSWLCDTALASEHNWSRPPGRHAMSAFFDLAGLCPSYAPGELIVRPVMTMFWPPRQRYLGLRAKVPADDLPRVAARILLLSPHGARARQVDA
jgi:hypothetical protein